MKTLHLEGLSVFRMAHGKHEVDKSISSESFSIEILWPDHFLRCPKSQCLFFYIAHKFGRKTISQVFLAIIKSAHSFEESVFSCCSSIQLTMSEQGFGFSLKRIQNCWCTNFGCSKDWTCRVMVWSHQQQGQCWNFFFYLTHRLNRLRRCEGLGPRDLRRI